MKCYFKTSVTTDQINKQLDSVMSPIQTVINQKISESFGIPVPKPFKNEFAKSRLYTYERFLLIESDPDVMTRVSTQVNTLAHIIQEDFLSK